ncbi:MAG: T9SS type A sorting domain-containing protein, partial [Flavobacteriaceae bacterium]|nr:T9SS type A sorting domain-containing protein [Flavobacteriaceae bacterium]
GNPYASAIDANQFILDNGSIIAGAGATTGTLYFWEHWGGGSHNLSEYQGGYATYNLSGGTPSAAQGTNDPDVGTGGTPTKTPGRYIPVGQGFFVVAESGGTINFNNGQRIFRKEAANSVFMEAPPSDQPIFGADTNVAPEGQFGEIEDLRTKLRIGFNSVNTMRRQLLFTIDENATEGIDLGYDGKLYEDQVDDIFWLVDDQELVIQGSNVLSDETKLPLGLYTATDGFNSIVLDGLFNEPYEIEVLLHDKELNLFHNLSNAPYEFYMLSGEYLERFEIVFKAVQTDEDEEAVGDEEDIIEEEAIGDDEVSDTINVYFSNDSESIVVVNPSNFKIESIVMFNVIGQKIYSATTINSDTSYAEYKVSNLSTGTYILKIESELGNITKKVLIE